MDFPSRRLSFFPGISFFILALALYLPSALADVTVTLPLHGYYHPGRYMPVRVQFPSGLPSSTAISLLARGAMTTRLPLGRGGGDTLVVPWLVFDGRPEHLGYSVTGSPRRQALPELRALAVEQRLVAYTTDPQSTHLLFPGDEIIPIALDPAQPFPGAAAAWESLDGVVLDAAEANRLGEPSLAALVTAGVAVAVHGDVRPGADWPWERQGEYWILRHVPAGLAAATYTPSAYRPVASWEAGWPPEFRRTIVLIGVLFAIGSIGIILWRPPFQMPILFAAVVAGIVALGYWWHYQIPVEECGGPVIIVGGGWAQSDYWAYQTAASAMPSDVRWGDVSTKPVFEHPGQLDTFVPTLACYPNGDPRLIHYDIPAHGKIALLTRNLGPRSRLLAPDTPVTSPLLPMVEQMYLSTGDRVTGQLPSAPMLGSGYVQVEQWPGVLVEKAKPASPTSAASPPP